MTNKIIRVRPTINGLIAIRKDCSPEEVAKEVMTLLVTDTVGIYIPKVFIEQCGEKTLKQIKEQTTAGTIESLKDPYNRDYWEAWGEVVERVLLTNEKGEELGLYESGDLWLINWTVLQTFSDECQSYFWEMWE